MRTTYLLPKHDIFPFAPNSTTDTSSRKSIVENASTYYVDHTAATRSRLARKSEPSSITPVKPLSFTQQILLDDNKSRQSKTLLKSASQLQHRYSNIPTVATGPARHIPPINDVNEHGSH